MKHRFVNRLRAFITGYFWLPCPHCGKKFGGHEWRDIGGHYSSVGNTGICPDCTKAGVGDRWTLFNAIVNDQPEFILAPLIERMKDHGMSVHYSGIEGLPEAITCPVCLMTSHNPNDIAQGYCGNCKVYTGVPQPDETRRRVALRFMPARHRGVVDNAARMHELDEQIFKGSSPP